MNSSVLLRPARPSDAAIAASLLHLSMGRTVDLFAEDGESEKLLSALFVRAGNRFSHQFGAILEAEGKVVGLLLAYPAGRMPMLDLTTGLHLFLFLGFRKMLRLVQRMIPMMDVHEAERGEFYIGNVAVQPEFQGRGFGTRLISFAEEQARGSGLKRCSLIVDANNGTALHLYQKIGYRIVFSGKHKSDYHRMVKDLV